MSTAARFAHSAICEKAAVLNAASALQVTARNLFQITPVRL